MDKSEPVNWPSVWWILAADHLTFEGVMGDFRKTVLQPDFERKKYVNKSLMAYNAENKNLTPLYVEWSCQPFRGWGKKRIWHLCKCHPSTKWLARDHDVVVFKTKVLHFKIENTPIKDTNGKRKFKRMLSFLFVDKRKLFAMKLSFEEFNLVFYTADRSTWLVLNQPRQRGFWRHLRYIPYAMIKEKYVFKKEFFSTFWHRRERKTTKCAFEIDFFTMCSTDLTCVNATI